MRRRGSNARARRVATPRPRRTELPEGPSREDAAGYELIRILEDEKLVENAAAVGRYFTEAAWALNDPWIGDVRFTGLLGGIELVKNIETREVLGKAEMAKIKDVLHDAGMLITVSGLHGNVLRLQPPLTFTTAMVDQFCAALRKTLQTVRGG
jgi:4-aminobutyrate aminotransferase-like enzyme